VSEALIAELGRDGFALVPNFASPHIVERLLGALADAVEEGRGGGRNLLDDPAVRGWVASAPVTALARSVLGVGATPVRAILFDKTADANWRVTWHQDVTIAVMDRVEVGGFGPWSQKEGVWHVQPPASVLERMIAIRLHLDPCGPQNGPVRVLPGSHRAGKLRESEYEGWRARVEERPCLAAAGDLLLMRPLLLHASSPATVPGHRRVLHVEYAAGPLPDPLRWRWEPRVESLTAIE